MSSDDSTLPPGWAELAPLVDQILDAPLDRREALLDKLSNGDANRRTELRKLAIECEMESPLLDRPAAESFAELFSETDDIQPGTVVGDRYRIEHEAGRGGMAIVFRARDLKHNRDVAVKVIRRDVAASFGSARFLQEIAIAARLRHPNIVPMYDSGESDGLLFFVMPFEEGPSLRARMKQTAPLSLVENISVLRDIARALAYAHDRGVVHRDVKPDNVLLSGGAAVVSDFGIAKAVSAALSEAPGGTITQAGGMIGTPAYMAPEQSVGDPKTDHRADIYAFGCLAYELFSGAPPFDKLGTHEIITAHLGQKPVPVEVAATTVVPPAIATLIMRCLEKLPADRPQSAHELLEQLESGQTHEGAAKTRRAELRSRNVATIAVVAIAAMLTAGFFIVRQRNASAAPHEVTVAVLPLLGSGDSTDRELAYGLSDEIATALVKVPGVRVMSRRGIAASREERDVDPQKTGQALGAEFLVMGSLKQAGGRFTVLAKLVQAKDGAMLWADQFDRSIDDLNAVREEIAKAVGDSLSRKSGIAASGASKRPARPIAPEPYRLYVLAQRALNVRGQSIQSSADLFKRAIELDTLYAEAYSGLSLALALSPYFKPVSTMSVAREAASAAQRALDLDSTLAQPHVALGILHSQAYRWDSAGVEFRTALRLRSPSDVEPLVQYGRYLLFEGQVDAALQQFLAARSTEPASALVRSWVAYSYYVKGQMDSAVVENRRAFQSDSTNLTTVAFGLLIFLKRHDLPAVRDYLNRISRYQQQGFYIRAAIGDTAGTNARLRELEQRHAPPWLIENSRAFTMLGARDTAGSIAAFERAADLHDVWPTQQPTMDPVFDPIRSNPRFQLLLHRVGLK